MSQFEILAGMSVFQRIMSAPSLRSRPFGCVLRESVSDPQRPLVDLAEKFCIYEEACLGDLGLFGSVASINDLKHWSD